MLHLFSSTLFTGMESHSYWKNKGTFLVRDNRYWFPLMSACLGTRIDELAQLRVKHIKTATDKLGNVVPYISLKDMKLRVKEASSRRIIPFHRYLIELGFYEDRVLNRKPEEFVFPEIVAENELGKRSGPFLKFFDRLCSYLGINKSMHEFRNTFITEVHRKAAEKHIAHCEALTGHASKNRSAVFMGYSDEMTAVELKPVIDLVELPIDIEAMKLAAKTAIPWRDFAAWRLDREG